MMEITTPLNMRGGTKIGILLGILLVVAVVCIIGLVLLTIGGPRM